MIRPIQEMISPKHRFKMTEGMVEAFHAAKKVLQENKDIAIRQPDEFDPLAEYHLFIDSSNFNCLAACLFQMQKVKGEDMYKLYLVSVFSEAIPRRDFPLPIWELELSAIQYFKYYLTGRHFHLWTDSKTVKFWVSMKVATARTARNLHFLANFTFSVHFLASELN